MLVIQRSLRKSASLVGAREQAHQHSRRCLSCVAEGKAKKAGSAPAARRSESGKFHYTAGSGDIFLQGKPVLLQHRLSSKAHINLPSNPVTSLCDNKPSKNFAFPSPRREKHVRKKRHKSEAKTRPSSQNSRNINCRETVLQPRKRKARTPLLMSTMSLPNENLATLTSKEASKRHLNREEAQATLERLLATRNHQLPSTSTGKPLGSTEEAQLLTEDKSAYLQNSYDYLFQRHLQNLNSVIHNYNQQEIHETSQSSQKQKKRVDIYQNYCGDNTCVKNELESFPVERNDSAHASDSSTQRSSKCDDYYTNYSVLRQSENIFLQQKDSSGIDSQVRTDTHNIHLTPPSGECKLVHRVGTYSEDHVANFRSTLRSAGPFDATSSAMESQNVRAASSSTDRSPTRASSGDQKNGGFLCINVSNQFQDINLEEVEPAISKPVITLNHVSESFAAERYEVSVIRPPRSPSPLLEVPPTADLQQESLRPPLE